MYFLHQNHNLVIESSQPIARVDISDPSMVREKGAGGKSDEED